MLASHATTTRPPAASTVAKLMDLAAALTMKVVVVATADCLVNFLGKPALSYVLEACSGLGLVVVAARSLSLNQLERIRFITTNQHELLFKGDDLQEKLLESAKLDLENARGVLVIRGDLALLTNDQLRSLPEHLHHCKADWRFPVLESTGPPPALLQQLGVIVSSPPDPGWANWALGLAATSSGCASSWPHWIRENVQEVLCKHLCQPSQNAIYSHLQSSLVSAANPALHAAAEAYMQQQLIRHMRQSGISFQDPGGTHIHADVNLEPGVQIGVGVQLYGNTHIQRNAIIEGPTYIRNSTIAAHCHIKPFCHLEDCSIAEGCQIGPYARLRPGASLKEGVFLGNFVEVKNSCMGARSQASHLAYIGDADVGEQALIADGCITCNFDGKQKHRTSIGNAAFVGSNTVMVAPVSIGDHAITGAGSIITEGVPPHALGIARSRQTIIEGYAQRRQAPSQ